MSGIYIHVPFCKQRCAYCDFYTEVAPQFIETYIDALVREFYLRKDYLPVAPVRSIYFGGGTPSVLSVAHFNRIFNAVSELYKLDEDAEITLEANPDDLTDAYLSEIASLPFERLSIGVQSFDDGDLKRINRRHTSLQAIEAVRNAQKAGFMNISIDLIYGLPGQDLERWKKQLEQAFALKVQHISAYGLTYEEGTKLWRQRAKGEVRATTDETMNEMYQLLLETVKNNGFEAYEISNFAKPGFRSRHNSSYWKQRPYIGLGPSAHSFDGVSRQWNVASIRKYTDALANNSPSFEREELTLFDRYNDYIMVSLRTSEGIDEAYIRLEFGKELASYCLENIKRFIQTEKIYRLNGNFRLTTAGILISDHIIMTLMKV
ncbi:MAG: radical SAM family heme chaperone HemW [Prevotellaceae bacterium]|nr:radical SAM family heme chaperone HemW [Prevotellaceae bacterium]